MLYPTLEKQLNNLSVEQRQSVFDYINFLIYQNKTEKEKTIYRTPGGLTGIFYIADDFDETPECFKDYV